MHQLLCFTAGADIKEMQNRTFQECYGGNFLAHWNRVSTVRKPVIAAVNGFAVCAFLFDWGCKVRWPLQILFMEVSSSWRCSFCGFSWVVAVNWQ